MANKNVKKTKIKLASGVELTIPEPTESQIPVGFHRKTRHLKGEEAQGEVFWLLLEEFLTDEELAVWDSVSEEDSAEAMENKAAEDLGK